MRVKKIMAQLFNIDEKIINDDTSSDTITNWDSIAHMNLVVALEEEFGITFNDQQMIEMLNYPLILLTVKEACNS